MLVQSQNLPGKEGETDMHGCVEGPRFQHPVPMPDDLCKHNGKREPLTRIFRLS